VSQGVLGGLLAQGVLGGLLAPVPRAQPKPHSQRYLQVLMKHLFLSFFLSLSLFLSLYLTITPTRKSMLSPVHFPCLPPWRTRIGTKHLRITTKHSRITTKHLRITSASNPVEQHLQDIVIWLRVEHSEHSVAVGVTDGTQRLHLFVRLHAIITHMSQFT